MKNRVSGDIDQKKADLAYWRNTGLGLFFQFSGWLVIPLLIGLFAGQWLDSRYGTKPWLFLLCLAAAFIITCSGLVIETLKFIKSLEKDVKRKDDRRDS